jgi:hypothetical protein
MQWVAIAEEMLVRALDGDGCLELHEAGVLGFLLFCLHGRQRCSDGARITEEPVLDTSHGNGRELFSFIEATTSGDACKTGNTSKKARLAIPVVGLAYGVSGQPWADAWLRIRKTLRLNASRDACLMREPLADGTFTEARIKPGQATQWLRHILLKLGAEPTALRNIGSHSCKTTLLSVAAKGGLPRDTRRTLGGHATPGDDSVDTYSRDVLAAPLLELAQLLGKVRAGTFDPDATRSGRWHLNSLNDFYSKERQCAHCSGPLAGHAISACQCGNFFHTYEDSFTCSKVCGDCGAEFCTQCDSVSTHVCTTGAVAPILAEESDDSLATDNDSDGEVAAITIAETEETFVEACAHQRLLEKGASMGDDAIVPEEGVFINRVSGTAHKVHRADAEKSACGVVMNPLSFSHDFGETALIGATLCWRSGCSNWMAKIVEPEPTEDEAIPEFLPTSPAARSDDPIEHVELFPEGLCFSDLPLQ